MEHRNWNLYAKVMVVLRTDFELEDKRSGSGKILRRCVEIDGNGGKNT